MKTYVNASGVDIELPIGSRTHVIKPEQLFTFDDTAENGDDIATQLEAAGAVEVTS